MSPYKQPFSPERFRKTEQFNPERRRLDSTPQESIRPDFLDGTTPISPEEERGMENRAESGAAEDREKSKKSSSPEEIKSGEEGGASATPTRGDKEESKAPGLFNAEGEGTAKSAKKGRYTKKQKWIAGGGVGLVVGSLFGVFTVLQGPLMFLHFSKLLQGFHFGINEETGNVRSIRLLRYMRDGRAERIRMGVIGNTIADHYEKALSRNGITSKYGDFSTFKGFDIDPRIAEPDGRYAGRSLDSIETELRSFDDITVERVTVDVEGTPREVIRINPTKKGFFGTRSFFSSTLSDIGMNGTSSQIGKRILGRRAGITLHPMRKLDNKIFASLDARYTKWQQDRAKRIHEGEKARIRTADVAQDEKDPTKDAKNQARADTDAVIDESQKLGTELDGKPPSQVGPLESIRTSTGFKLTAGGAAAVGIVCALKGIADNVDAMKYANVVLPLVRMGMEMVAVGGQIMTGQDFSMETLGFYAKQMYDQKTGSSWAAARSVQAELGKEQTGPDINDEARIPKGQNAAAKLVNQIPGIDGICKAAGSVVGQVGLTAIGFLGGPVTELVTQGVFRLYGDDAIKKIVNILAGHPIDVEVAGADFSNYVNHGARLAANEHALSAGGRKLPDSESAQLKSRYAALQRERFQNAPLSERLFAIGNQYSLVGNVLGSPGLVKVSAPSSLIAQAPQKVMGALGNFGALFTPKPVYAAAGNYSYGFPLIATTEEELSLPEYENPFENGERIEQRLQSEPDALKKDVKDCFGDTIADDGKVTFSGRVENIYSEDYPARCDDQSNKQLMDLRQYLGDIQTLESMACYAEVEDSCRQLGFGEVGGSSGPNETAHSQIVGDIGEHSDNVDCAPGTNSLGVVESLYTGAAKKTSDPLRIRLCQIPEIGGNGQNTEGVVIGGGAVVNSRVSGAWLTLARDAKRDNISLGSSSSFRLADSCGGGGTGGRCATPGSSYHQLGVAIDVADIEGIDESVQTCDARLSDPDSPSWVWLANNAERYGIKQYSAEAWHWDPANLPNRCGKPT